MPSDQSDQRLPSSVRYEKSSRKLFATHQIRKGSKIDALDGKLLENDGGGAEESQPSNSLEVQLNDGAFSGWFSLDKRSQWIMNASSNESVDKCNLIALLVDDRCLSLIANRDIQPDGELVFNFKCNENEREEETNEDDGSQVDLLNEDEYDEEEVEDEEEEEIPANDLKYKYILLFNLINLKRIFSFLISFN